MEDILKKEASLLFDEEILDDDTLIKMAGRKTYISLDEDVTVCRFRGDLIKKTSYGYEIVSWQRNISRIQKMDASLPTIIKLKVNEKFVVTEIDLQDGFAGSKVILCFRPYLDKVLKHNIIGKKLDLSIVSEIKVENLFCFHLVEVLLGTVSCLQLMNEHNLDYIFEEEVLDSIIDGKNLIVKGKQKFSFSPKVVNYTINLVGVLDYIRFNKAGNIYLAEDVEAVIYKDNEELLRCILNGNSEKRLYLKIRNMSNKLVKVVKKDYTDDDKNLFMCSNLFPQGFIGAFVQCLAMKMYSNNYNYILRCLDGLQRYTNKPRCVGGLKDYAEAEKYFEGFDIMEALTSKN